MELGVSLEAASLFVRSRGKAVYILLSSDPTLALLLVGFTKYDDDDSVILEPGDKPALPFGYMNKVHSSVIPEPSYKT
ncbi:hypothetical protein Hanom_Chr12g01171731 [Helianthus anomalus]